MNWFIPVSEQSWDKAISMGNIDISPAPHVSVTLFHGTAHGGFTTRAILDFTPKAYFTFLSTASYRCYAINMMIATGFGIQMMTGRGKTSTHCQ
jgi:hypothetical protein